MSNADMDIGAARSQDSVAKIVGVDPAKKWKTTKVIAVMLLGLAGVLALAIIGGNVVLALQGRESVTLSQWGGTILGAIFGNLGLTVVMFFFDRDKEGS